MIIITNSKLCTDFREQIRKIAKQRPAMILLREKEVSKEHRRELAEICLDLCKKYQIVFGINSDISLAKKLQVRVIHLSFSDFMQKAEELDFEKTGVSVHSVKEAVEAQNLGADYLIAGHIFPTECKKGLPGRGLSYLKEICESVRIPVYAIGGITDFVQVEAVKNAKAADFCVMSGAMQADNVGSFIKKITKQA